MVAAQKEDRCGGLRFARTTGKDQILKILLLNVSIRTSHKQAKTKLEWNLLTRRKVLLDETLVPSLDVAHDLFQHFLLW